MSATLYTRSRGDYRADNSRLRDVSRCAARVLARYSWTDDVQRHFSVEPVGPVGYFNDLDVAGDWRALFEALIVAGAIEPDHLGLPDAVGAAVFLRVQSFVAASGGMLEHWRTESMFEVMPGALTYAMTDAASIELYYRDTGRAVRVVRDVVPVAARLEYLDGVRDLVTDSQTIGLIEAGAVPNLPSGYAVIADAEENPDGAVLGSAFWPARIVLQGVPGPMGPRGLRGYPGLPGGDSSGGGVLQGMAGGGGTKNGGDVGTGWRFTVDPWADGLGFRMRHFLHDVELAGDAVWYSSIVEARDAAVLWLLGMDCDAWLYVVEPKGAGWSLSCYEGGAVVEVQQGQSVVVGLGVPALGLVGVPHALAADAVAAGEAWVAQSQSGAVPFDGLGNPPAWIEALSVGSGYHIAEFGVPWILPIQGIPWPADDQGYPCLPVSERVNDVWPQKFAKVRDVAPTLATALAAVKARQVAANPGGYDTDGWYLGYAVIHVDTGLRVIECGGEFATFGPDTPDGSQGPLLSVGAPIRWCETAGDVAALVETPSGPDSSGGGSLWVTHWDALGPWSRTYAATCDLVGFSFVDELAGVVRVPGMAPSPVPLLYPYQGVPLSGPELGLVVMPATVGGAAMDGWLGKDGVNPSDAWGRAYGECEARWGVNNFRVYNRAPVFVPDGW